MAKFPLVSKSTDDQDTASATDRGGADRRSSTMTAERGRLGGTKVDERPPRARDAVGVARPATATVAKPVASGGETTRARASLLAMAALVLGVSAGLTVLTGVLARAGVAVGVLAVMVAIGGLSATSRPHLTGRSAAWLGLLLGLGAVVVGVLSFTGALPWLPPETDNVTRVRDWLDAHLRWPLADG